MGFAVTQTSGGIQIALTAFAISFPALVAALFFAVLWVKPYVLYPPTDFSAEVTVGGFVDAMRHALPGRLPSEAVLARLQIARSHHFDLSLELCPLLFATGNQIIEKRHIVSWLTPSWL